MNASYMQQFHCYRTGMYIIVVLFVLQESGSSWIHTRNCDCCDYWY